MDMPLRTSDSVFVAGEWVKPVGAPEPVLNPATEDVIGYAPVGGKAEIEQAIAAAREAFDVGPWPRMSPQERAAKMQALYDGLMERKVDIMRLIVEEAGSTIRVGEMIQFGMPMNNVKYFIDAGARNRDIAAPIGMAPGANGPNLVGSIVRREPVGVVAAITPFNFPYYLNIMKIFPALVTGNTMVLKPSPLTPFAALIIADAAAEIGLPRGVLSIVTGGNEVGEMLTSDPRVDMVTFTGSDATGAAIMAQAAPTLKRVQFELGGKSVHIVRADADLAGALQMGASFIIHAGQGCALLTRHLVHNSIRAGYVAALASALEHVKVGDPSDASVSMGPLIRDAHRTRVEHFVAEGRKGGATLVTGGRRPKALKKGFFYEPTLFDNVDNKSTIAQEEIFGPVAVVIGFDRDEEAVALANDSKFGLSGSIFSKDIGAAFSMASAVRTGTISINGGGSAGGPPAPFGGFKRSGIGRENGEEGLNAFTELKSVSFRST
ncbi:MAG: aldehyde dehydrogenase family protein [Caulobacteraceae bacterium]